MRIAPPLAVVALVVAVAPVRAADPPPVEFRLTFDKAALDGPFTGRVFVLLTKSEPNPVSRGINWFGPEPVFAKDVVGWKPGDELTVGADALAYPTPLASVKPGRYFVQAVMDRDQGGISFATTPGNVYSAAVAFDHKPGGSGPPPLRLDRVYDEPPVKETDTFKQVEVESKLLTEFHGKPTKLRGWVVLPPSFAKETDRKYPVVYEIPGFGDHPGYAKGVASRKPTDVAGTEVLWVVLDANCRLGHHVFADSENNGPVGKALTEELIPQIEKAYRGVGVPAGRVVTGHSSGGWSSLWLQVAYPDFFNGCWSTSPDPVDFRDFQRVNLYGPDANLFTDRDGEARPLSRSLGGRQLMYKTFSDMENVMGHGGQLGSFEAVFSPRGEDGKPRQLWDRKTGAINSDVAKAWEKYDVRMKVEREWKEIGPKLAGKIHVYMGEEDTFLLEGAAKLLKQSFERLGSDAVVELFPKKTHALVDADLRKRINREMAAAVKGAAGP